MQQARNQVLDHKVAMRISCGQPLQQQVQQQQCCAGAKLLRYSPDGIL